jgi:hypothetical protein
MRKFVSLLVLLGLLAAGFALTPLWVAMDLRRAAMTGDLVTLEARVDWPAVRQSLKDSLAELERIKQAEATLYGLPRPSLWSRIKAAATPTRYADQIIDRYVTADGVVKVAAARGNMKALLSGGFGTTKSTNQDIDIPDHARPLVERAQLFWSRLKRVTALSPGLIEIEMADKRVPERSYVGQLSFEGLRWRVVSVRVAGVGF